MYSTLWGSLGKPGTGAEVMLAEKMGLAHAGLKHPTLWLWE